MKHKDLVELVKKSGDYVGDIEFGQCNDFIGFVYVKNYKFKGDELQNHFSIPLQSEPNQ